ncbi:MAG: AsmA family protein, partial [Candidatus Binatia bacterium]
MRKIVIALVILLILSGVVVLALMNLSGLVNRNKGYLLAQAEQTLGRKVTVEKIGVTLWGGIGVRLSNFALADDPTFSQENFLQAADLQVNVEFLPLFWKELRVTRLILHQPAITIIRDKRGQFNFASLGAATTQSATEQTDTAEHSSSSTAEPFPLVASLMDLSAGTVRYIDRRDQTDFQVKQFDLTIEDLSFDQPFVLNLTTAVLAERQNLNLQSRLGPLGPTLDFKNLPVEGILKIDSLDLNALQQALPQLTARLPQGLGLSGPLQATITMAGSMGALTLSNVELTTAVFTASKPNVKIVGRVGPLGTALKDLSLQGDVEL